MGDWPQILTLLRRSTPRPGAPKVRRPPAARGRAKAASKPGRSARPTPVKVLVVGQTPPPYHGQAVMVQRLLDSPLDGVRLHHVRVHFSRSVGDVGKFRLGKLLHLPSVIARIALARLAHGTDVLYYPPSGAGLLPVLKDLAILACTRWMFRKTVFHIHAGGTSQIYPRLNAWQRWLYRRVMWRPDAVIRLSDLTPEDGAGLQARREFLVPNGIPDALAGRAERVESSLANATDEVATERRPLRLLYVGALNETKGVLDLVAACGLLQSSGVPFRLTLVGQCSSPDFERQLAERIEAAGLSGQVERTGVLTGDAKFDRFAEADVFCFPSFYECEAFPLVLLEALSFGLPVVASRWRGIPSIVADGESGLLIEPRCPRQLAERLDQLARSPALRQRLGRRARERFLAEFTDEVFARRMEHVLREVAQEPGGDR